MTGSLPDGGGRATVPPPLPPIRRGVAYIVVPVTALWFVAFVALLFFTGSLREHDAMIWLWTCLAGWILGLVGLAVHQWQRSAARRGHRGAQSSALD
jgi:hypothetical protein